MHTATCIHIDHIQKISGASRSACGRRVARPRARMPCFSCLRCPGDHTLMHAVLSAQLHQATRSASRNQPPEKGALGFPCNSSPIQFDVIFIDRNHASYHALTKLWSSISFFFQSCTRTDSECRSHNSVAPIVHLWSQGYLQVDRGMNTQANFHYIFVESERTPSKDNLTLWLNGASSLQAAGRTSDVSSRLLDKAVC